ncbi:MAG TPA: two-component regulator propeller domain-containing protein [Bacteroidia bacterium]|nr:two-component regulator propeller domain-containing protein [Bacteroidia bacterium]HNU32074.1 two-component regulator propeller domain-containing protein [Bacteroidia bacterium]
MRKLILTLTLIISFTRLQAQSLALGQWRSHFSYKQVQLVTEAGNKIYCGSPQTIFYFDKEDNSINTLSRVNGLSDVGVGLLQYGKQKDVVVVGYNNSNIDLIYNDRIVNIADIKRKNTTGDKTLYGVTFNNKYAYLATGLGIVVVDLDKAEIKDTYVIGPNGIELKIYDLTTDGSYLYAATPIGIYKAEISNPLLNDFSQWQNILPNSINQHAFTRIAYANSKLLCNLSFDFTGNRKDSIYIYDLNTTTVNVFNQGYNYPNLQIKVNHNNIVIVNYFSALAFDINLTAMNINAQGYSLFPNLSLKDAVLDKDGFVWMADGSYGLMKFKSTTDIINLAPNGPFYPLTAQARFGKNKLWVSHGSIDWRINYFNNGISEFSDETWKTYDKNTAPSNVVNLNNISEWQSIAIDPRDEKHVFIGSRVNGLLEYYGGQVINFYRDTNSTLRQQIGNPGVIIIGGMQYDTENNLWIVNSSTTNCLHKLSPEGVWQSYSFPQLIPNNELTDLLIDSYGQIWINARNAGIVVFNPSTNQSVFLKNEVGKGNLPTNEVRSIAEDKDGQVWVGTSKGVAVFYSPGSIFSGSNFDAQQILVTQNSINQYLLAAETVTAITIDGANRKWFGTQSSGVFLTSADGTNQLLSFNKENSPLPANRISAITINDKTGEVFFGTESGLLSYLSDATKGEEFCDDVIVFPNPVRENYSGPIAIRGVVANGNVKITDVAGNIVYEVVANGGEAIWYGQNFKGEKVQTGIYLVFSTDDTGENTCMTKLLLVN